MTESNNSVLCSAILPLLSTDYNDYWFINLTVYHELMIAMVLLFTLVCFIAGYIVVMWCSLGLQLKNIPLHPRPRPHLQSQIRPRPDSKKSNPVQPY